MKGVSRRGAIKTIGVAAAAPLFRLKAAATSSSEESRGFRLQAEGLDAATLAAIADLVLPSEADRTAAVSAFTQWIANYQESADTDHGYGNTRVRSTGPSPARNYPAQIAALAAAAKAKGATGFAAASLDRRRAIVDAADATAN